MTISVSPFAEPWSIPDRTRPTFTISQTITASASLADEEITNVTATVDGTEPDLVITPGTTSVAITGSFADPYSDSFTYIDAGQSDKTQTPTTVSGVDNLPADKIFFDLDQDMTAYTTKTFIITVSYDLINVAQTPETFTLTMKINNEWEGIRSVVDNYY
tara:strand:+ start:1150 stop:1629 length:480 start_codon:yes stop_codon:yes gene_type:complete